MGYPVLANWIKFKKVGEDEYLVKDLLLDTQFNIDIYSVWFARQLNGKKNPYTIDIELSKDDVDSLLYELESKNIIRNYRFLSKYFLFLLVTVWRPHITSNARLVAFVINTLLLVSWLPVLAFSVYYTMNNLYDISGDYIVIGSITGVFVGIFFHELGHMFACLAYGGRVFEAGIALQYFIPGAYVLINKSNIKNRMRRIQVSAAGIEMNLLLAGIFLILSTRFSLLSGFFLGAAINNVFLTLLNLTFINGFDGMAIMGELFGVNDLVEKAKNVTKNNFRKKTLYKDGISGKATVVICYIIRFVQVALPLLFAVNIVEVLLCFL